MASLAEIAGRSYESAEAMRQRVGELDAQYAGKTFPAAAKKEWHELNAVLDESKVRRERVRELASDSHAVERIGVGDDHNLPSGIATNDLRARALAANERAVFLPEASREHMEQQLREDDDPDARLARYVVETSKRDYLRAFARVLNDPVAGAQTWSNEEREAVRGVRWIERSMNLTGAQGGFLVPYELDPSIIISSTGYVDPMRAVARVTTTAYNEKRFVTSTGVTSHWYAEEAEVTDDSPALLQPTVTCRKAMAFAPVSFELFEDSDIAQQIGRVFADSKAAEEARVFTTGNGTTEPKGIITALVAAGGSTVIATGTNVLAQGDLYANQAALPARWRSNARWMMNLSILNGYRQLPQATGLNYSIVNDDGPAPKALGWEISENSSMDATLTGSAADYLVLSGSFEQYAIVDRIGASIEVLPHLLGANRRPSGQRGFLMHWRVGADVLVADAFRLSNFST
jgi:HK97 family phage major capsid protein